MIVLSGSALLSGCQIFSLNRFDERAYQYLAGMQAQHVSLIDTFTEPQERPSVKDVKSACREGELIFLEADAYVVGRGSDRNRRTAFEILHKGYSRDCSDLMERAGTRDEPFYTRYAADALKKERLENYSFAMDGEWNRLRGE